MSVTGKQPFGPSNARSTGVAWIGLNAFAAFGSWALLEKTGHSFEFVWFLLALGFSVGSAFLIFSRWARPFKRAIIWAISTGLMYGPILFIAFGLAGFAYFILIPQTQLIHALQWLSTIFAATVWSTIDLRALQKRVEGKRYMEREFVEFDDHVALRWDRGTNIDPPPISDGTLLGRVWNRHGLKLFLALAPLSGAGYAMSRLLDQAGGIEALLLVLAALGLPFSMFMVSKLVCGIYLNIYKVWQVERKTGKPVLFDHIPDE